MEQSDLIQQYISKSANAGVTIEIELLTESARKMKIIENKIYINPTLISHDDFELYLSYLVRKLVLPKIKFETERLLIRRYEERDHDDCFDFLKDRETCYMDGGYEPFEAMNEAYDSLIQSFKADEGRLMIYSKTDQKVIGVIHLMDVKERAVETMEIGYVIAPQYRRCGYAYEALSALIDKLQEDFKLDLLVAGAIEENIPSIQLLKKLGFIYEGKRIKAFYHPCYGAIDLVYYYKER